MALFRRNRSPVPDGWHDIVEHHFAHWRLLDADERDALGMLVERMLTNQHWEAARGFAMTDRVRVVIAAQASLLILGMDPTVDWYREVHTVVVHPTTMRVDRTAPGSIAGTETCGAVDLIGEAAYLGPVVIAWDAASAAARHPRRGHDVVIHEFAHKLDMLDGVVNGTPPIANPDLLERWVAVCSDAYHRLEEEHNEVIDDYGATDAGEFFAVVAETFITRPLDLERVEPDLYEVLRDFFGQDPAARVRRAMPRPLA